MKKLIYLIVLIVILSLVLTGCFLSNVGQIPTTEQSGISYLTKSPGPDLVGLWHFDGDALDSSGNGNDGTLHNFVSPHGWVSGMFGQALSFDGSDDYVDCGTNVVITTAITIEAWINPSAFTNYDAIVANFVWPTNPEGYSFRVMDNGKLVWRAVLSGNSAYSITSDSIMEAGNWYHVVLTHDASCTRLYINGILDKEDTPGGTIVNLGKSLKVGWDTYAADRVFNGTIDEVRIWDEALTAGQIEASYNGGLRKELDRTTANLGDHVGVTLDVVVALTDPPVTVVDTLPSELRYIPSTFEVDGNPAIPTVDGQEISCNNLGFGAYTITFDAQVTSVEATLYTVANEATADGASASAELAINPYEGFTKVAPLQSTEDGDGIIEVGEEIIWDVTIIVTNILGDEITLMSDIVVQDRFGGELEIDEGQSIVSEGFMEVKLSGKTEKPKIKWNTFSLGDGALATADLIVSTDVNPGGQHSYSTAGEYEMNSGAVLKFTDFAGTGFQLSAHTPQITVEVFEQLE